MDIKGLIPDADKAAGGVWIEYEPGAEFLVASTESPDYRKALQKASRRHPPQKLRKDPELALAITAEAMAQTILLDFKGVVMGGNPLTNTIENRRAILAVPTLRDWIAEQAQDIANFQQEGEAADTADLKKSP